jgi:transposase
MGTGEQLKLEIMFKVKSGELSQQDAAAALRVDVRTIRRYLKAFKEKGMTFIRHGNVSRAPTNRLPAELRRKVLALIEEKYFDFNVCHLQEVLGEELEVKISYTTLRRWCHSINMVKNARKVRRTKPRKARQRMSQEGYLLQLDGSHHYWFGGRFLCLMAAIDDATNEVFAKFYEGETSVACLDFLKEIVEKKGIMKFIYTDRAGLYGGIKREHFSQVERALGELGGHVIYAHSPEGKGRVERLFRTLQDRLVAELRFSGITCIDEANKYLQEVYLKNKHNPSFMVKAENPVTGYRSLPQKIDLNHIFCIKEYRVIGKDHTVSIRGERWMIADEIKHSIAKKKLELRFNLWGEWAASFAGRPIKLVKIKKATKIA